MPPQSIGTSLPVRHDAVRECRIDMLELAERLLAPQAVEPRGLTLVTELVEDASSPLYQHGGDLLGAVREARAALDDRA